MRARLTVIALGMAALGALVAAQAPRPHLNPMIDLLAQGKPVFGVAAPTAGRGGNRGGAPPADPATPPPPVKTPADLAKETLAYTRADYIFSGSMEGGVDRGLPAWSNYAAALTEAGTIIKSPYPHLSHPLVVKTQRIGTDYAAAAANIGKQLNTGVTTIMLVGVESAAEAEAGIKAMRFASKGGTRPDEVGAAPAHWGMTEAQYREKADVWPLNPTGELVNWTIVESKEGLAHVREIAAVKGIGVLWPGAGTLRGVFRNDPEGSWEAAIQQVLAACKEFKVACGYPANADDIEMRMKQGFSVFVIQSWSENGFKTVEIGRAAAGR